MAVEVPPTTSCGFMPLLVLTTSTPNEMRYTTPSSNRRPYPALPHPSINAGSFANLTEHRKYVDNMLKEELEHLYVGIPSFFDAFFGNVLAGKTGLKGRRRMF